MKRLIFIGEKGPQGLALDALRLAADDVKNTDNTGMYTEARRSLACLRFAIRSGVLRTLSRTL